MNEYSKSVMKEDSVKIFFYLEKFKHRDSGIPKDGSNFLRAIKHALADRTFRNKIDEILNGAEVSLICKEVSKRAQFLVGADFKFGDGIHIYQQIPPKPLLTRFRKRGSFHVSRVHDFFPMSLPNLYSRKERFSFWRRLKGIQEMDLLIPNSTETEKFTYDLGVPEADVRLLECSVPSFSFKPNFETKSDFALTKELGNYILAVGAIVPRKSPLALIDLWERKLAVLGINLVIVGERINGPLAKALDRAVKKHEESEAKIIFKSKISEEILLDFYRNASGFISMSSFEGFNIPLHDAVLLGIPVLCHTSGLKNQRIRDFAISNNNYFEFKDVGAFITRIKKVERIDLQDQLKTFIINEQINYTASIRLILLEAIQGWLNSKN